MIEVNDPADEPVEMFRRFDLERKEDVSGISGTGVVAQGCQFADGTVALHWLGDMASTIVYNSMEDLVAVHGHNGRTTVEWIDDTEGLSEIAKYMDQTWESPMAGSFPEFFDRAVGALQKQQLRELRELAQAWMRNEQRSADYQDGLADAAEQVLKIIDYPEGA